MKSKKRRPPRPVLREHMPVVLKRSFPSLKLDGGTLGVIVHVYPGGDAYEVEFFRYDGTSVGVATVNASLVSPVRRTVPALTPNQEALLSAITDSKLFTVDAVLARHAAVERIADKTGVSRKVVDTFATISAPGNAHRFTKSAARAAFAHLTSTGPDLQSRHVTPADGNVFEDLGFEPDEAARLLAEADRKIALLAMKEASIAGTIADANAAFKAGTLKQLTTSTQSRRLRVRTAPVLQLQIAHDFALLLRNERGQKAVVQYLYNELGQSSVAKLLGAKR